MRARETRRVCAQMRMQPQNFLEAAKSLSINAPPFQGEDTDVVFCPYDLLLT